jgi:hypothetical protein
MVKTSINVIVFFLVLTLFPLIFAQQPPTLLALTPGQSVAGTQNASSYLYYYSSFKTTKRLLAITLNPDHQSSMAEFFSLNDPVSSQSFTKYPNSTNYTHKCTHIDLNTCIMDLSDSLGNMPKRDLTVYFSIYASEIVAYSL